MKYCNNPHCENLVADNVDYCSTRCSNVDSRWCVLVTMTDDTIVLIGTYSRKGTAEQVAVGIRDRKDVLTATVLLPGYKMPEE